MIGAGSMPMLGPQEQRIRRMENEGRETLSDHERGPTSAELGDKVTRLQHRLEQESEKADRALRELRRYQHCAELSPTAADFMARQANDDRPLPPWATQMELLSPLCIAYD